MCGRIKQDLDVMSPSDGDGDGDWRSKHRTPVGQNDDLILSNGDYEYPVYAPKPSSSPGRSSTHTVE